MFYTDEGWVEAGDLEAGDYMLSLGGVYGEVESILIEERSQTMYDLTVEEVHTFAVGEGEWVVHNCTDYPSAGEIGEWENRQHNRPVGFHYGIYEYRSGGTGAWYVGQSWGQSLGARLSGKKPNFGGQWGNVTYSNIDFPNEATARIAERVRMEQLLADPSVGINNLANAHPDRITRTASRTEAMEFMSSGRWRNVPGWPSWLQLPSEMINLPEGWP